MFYTFPTLYSQGQTTYKCNGHNLLYVNKIKINANKSTK